MSEDELTPRQALLVLNGLPLMGPITLNRLLYHFEQDPVRILNTDAKSLQKVKDVGPAVADCITNWANHFDVNREELKLEQTGARFIHAEDDAYPDRLKEIYDPPIGLYCLGKYKLDRPGVAIVGSRKATLYGLSVAKSVAGRLASMGFCIISGMARGIDRAAHEGALQVDGKTIAVFGNGLDIIYPPENVDLYQEIKKNGAILSEFPFGKRANRTTFPMRNRVVSGMASAVIVVETDLQGGSMITARFAGDQGKPIFAVPGRIDMPSSAGCLQLIKDGATMLTSVDDFLDEMGYQQTLRQMGLFGTGAPGVPEPDKEKAQLPEGEAELKVYRLFEGGQILGLDEIAEQSDLEASQVASTLMLLELQRFLVKRADGRFEMRA